LPFTGDGIAFASVAIDGYAPAKDEDMRLNYETVGPQYFQTMRIRSRMAGTSMNEIRTALLVW